MGHTELDSFNTVMWTKHTHIQIYCSLQIVKEETSPHIKYIFLYQENSKLQNHWTTID